MQQYHFLGLNEDGAFNVSIFVPRPLNPIPKNAPSDLSTFLRLAGDSELVLPLVGLQSLLPAAERTANWEATGFGGFVGLKV